MVGYCKNNYITPPHSENKWSTDNGLAQVLIKQEDVEAGLGCPHKASAVLEAELRTLKGEIGCVVCYHAR